MTQPKNPSKVVGIHSGSSVDQPGPATEGMNSAELTGFIQRAAGLGIPNAQIAILVGMDQKAMEQKYLQTLKIGQAQANLKVSNALFTTAVTPNHPKHVSAAIFWAKSRLGWAEAVPGTISPGAESGADASHLTDVQSAKQKFASALEALKVDKPK